MFIFDLWQLNCVPLRLPTTKQQQQQQLQILYDYCMYPTDGSTTKSYTGYQINVLKKLLLII